MLMGMSRDEGQVAVGAAWNLSVILAAAYVPQGPDLDLAFDLETGEAMPFGGPRAGWMMDDSGEISING